MDSIKGVPQRRSFSVCRPSKTARRTQQLQQNDAFGIQDPHPERPKTEDAMTRSGRPSFNALLSAGLAGALALACGGGGGGGGGDKGSGTANFAPAITSQPVDQMATSGQGVSFTIGANGSPLPTFQWERSLDGATWTALQGATNPTHSFTAQLVDSGARFRARATNSVGSATSNAATLTVATPTLVWGAGGPVWGLALDSANNVYVSLFFQNSIKKYTATGSLTVAWGSSGSGSAQFNAPKYLATDGSDNIYVADNMNHRIQKFSSTGTYLLQFGGYGSTNGRFNGPAGLAVDSANGWVYVQDSNNNRIQKFDLSGNYLTQWGSFGQGNGQFRFIIPGDFSGGPEAGLAVDSAGNVYVVDNRNCRVQKFTSNGTYLTQWGGQGGGDAQFLFPSGLAVDRSRGFVYVVDNSTPGNGVGNVCKVVKFDLAGAYLSRWTTMSSAGLPESSCGIAIDSTGAVYVAQGNSIGKYLP
jgi:DNA-binding beta-propeller fold protein YncE